MYGLKNVRNRRSDSLSRVAWNQLESLLAIYYRGQGYRVDHVGTGATSARFDGGIDLKLHKDDQYIVVQCKHWNAKQVPHNDVHQLLGIMVNEGATGAILVTSGEFTAYARESAAKQGRVQLIDGDALREMIGPLPEPVAAEVAAGDERWARGYVDASEASPDPEGFVFREPFATKRRTPSRADASDIGWWFVALIGALGFVLVMRAVLERSAATAGNGTPTVRTASPESLPAPSGEAPAVMDDLSNDSQRSASSSQNSNPCHEVIDWQSGTYIDHCAERRPSKRPSAAELRELKRKADEAIKVLEASTPEV